jgi:hypothetical protein
MDFEDGFKCLVAGIVLWVFFAVTRNDDTNVYSLIYLGIGVLTGLFILIMGNNPKGAVIGMIAWWLLALVQCGFKKDLLTPFHREGPRENYLSAPVVKAIQPYSRSMMISDYSNPDNPETMARFEYILSIKNHFSGTYRFDGNIVKTPVLSSELKTEYFNWAKAKGLGVNVGSVSQFIREYLTENWDDVYSITFRSRKPDLFQCVMLYLEVKGEHYTSYLARLREKELAWYKKHGISKKDALAYSDAVGYWNETL